MTGRLLLSIMTLSGTIEEPAKFVQPVTGSHFNYRTCELAVDVHAHARRMFPLCARMADGYPASPDESMVIGFPNVKPMMLFPEFR